MVDIWWFVKELIFRKLDYTKELGTLWLRLLIGWSCQRCLKTDKNEVLSGEIMFKYIGNRRYIAIDDKVMDKNILEEICRLTRIQTDINAFNEAKKKYPKTIALSQAKYNQLLSGNALDNDTFYYIFDKETGKYIDGYMDI